MSFLDPWAEVEEHVRRMQIADPYDRYLQHRADVIADLFATNAHSIDAIALAGISLGALAEARFGSEVPIYQRKQRNQIFFRKLLTAHCPTFTNRTSIPEVLRACVRDRQFPRHEENVRDRYLAGRDGRAWTTHDDPLANDFHAWADEQKPPIPDLLRSFDYAGCIHKYYRNAVVHELRVAGGRDDDAPDNEDDEAERTIFYSTAARENERVGNLRFRIYPPYLLALLREAIGSVRAWALLHKRNVFSDGDENAER